MLSVGILGGTGYTGKKLLEYCNAHSEIGEVKVYANTSSGQKIIDLFPDLKGIVADDYVESINNISYEEDVFFIALPHGEALKYVPTILNRGKKIIDLGGDFRLNESAIYEKWYGLKHTSSELLLQKIYGLADYSKTDYSKFDLVANPGCYPTAALLSLLPIVSNFSDEIISTSVNAYSGTSGAGKSAKTELLMSEMDGNVSAYNVTKHRHEPEILQLLNAKGFESPFSFTTHLLPIAVGIYSTSVIYLKDDIDEQIIKNLYTVFYEDSFFVRMREIPPQLKWVTGTNFCDINVTAKNKTVIITAAIDNLIKGASGQAIQNLNKLYGWDETLGIFERGKNNVSVY